MGQRQARSISRLVLHCYPILSPNVSGIRSGLVRFCPIALAWPIAA